MILHWRWLDIVTNPRTRAAGVKLRVGPLHPPDNVTASTWDKFEPGLRRVVGVNWAFAEWIRNNPVDEMSIRFVRKSTYSLRFIVHPGGGSTMRIACDECGADYPFNWTMPSLSPCANCAVPKESGWRLKLGRYMWERVCTV